MNFAYIISALSLAFCIFFFFYFRSFIKRQTTADALLAEYRTEVYRLIAELDTYTDRDSRLVEERITTLKALLEDTDKRITVYVRELERSRSGEALYTSLGRGIRTALGPQPVQPLAAAQPAAVAQSQPVQLPAAQEAIPAVPVLPVIVPPPAQKQLGEQIAEMAAQGLSAGEIASQLDISLSEVDLALNLLNLKKR